MLNTTGTGHTSHYLRSLLGLWQENCKQAQTNFDILLTVHPNIFILILTNLMH